MNPSYMNTHTPLAYPKMTIITPSLNQGRFIDATIQSVLSQEYPNLEYIIMDGGSSDSTLDILESYSDRVKWVSGKDEGQSHAINSGLRMAGGEILAYLNADDLYLPGTLLKVARKFMENPDTMWITGKCRIINENGQEIRSLITTYKNLLLRLHNRPLLLMTNYISQPATFLRADVIRDFGLLEEGLHYTMDYDYYLKLNARYPLLFIPEYLSAFRVHPQSKSTDTGHRSTYTAEERLVVGRHTKSRFLQALHDFHRWLMTTIYSIINAG